VVFLVEEEAEAPNERAPAGEPKKTVGLDVELSRLVTLSDGRFLENPKPLERSFERIRVLQSLKKKVSFQKLA